MKPLRKNVAIAIDGGGIRGAIVARALALLEQHIGKTVHDIFQLAAGTSTGSILSAGIACGLSARKMLELYIDLGDKIFQKSWRTRFWPLTRYKYPLEPINQALEIYLKGQTMGDLWNTEHPTDLVITTFDLQTNRTRFVKPWKEEYQNWLVSKAVLASCSVPTYFPVVEGRFIDGGVGSYANPCYLAAYEMIFCLGWDPNETTLISLGTGRSPLKFDSNRARRMWPWQWLDPIMGAFLQSADDQQVHLVNTFFNSLDFRRFQVDLKEPIAMDDASKITQLIVYGDQLGRMILQDSLDASMMVIPTLPKNNFLA